MKSLTLDLFLLRSGVTLPVNQEKCILYTYRAGWAMCFFSFCSVAGYSYAKIFEPIASMHYHIDTHKGDLTMTRENNILDALCTVESDFRECIATMQKLAGLSLG